MAITVKSSAPARYAALDRFAARYLIIRDKLSRARPLVPNSVQRRYMQAKTAALDAGRPPRFIVLKSRRGGVTTWEQAESYHRVAIEKNVRAVTLAHDLESTIEIFDIARNFWREGYGIAKPVASKSNRREFLFHGESSKFWVGTAGAESFGRGFTLARVHGSEVASWPGTIDQQRGLVAGLTEAASHGEVVLESTARGMTGLFYELCDEARQGSGSWTLIFIPWWWDDTNALACSADEAAAIEASLTDEERLIIGRERLSPAQVKWRRQKRTHLKGLFLQEYPEDPIACFLRSGECYFDHATLDRLLAGAARPTRRRAGSGWELEWREPEDGHRYVIGADPSEGVSGGDPAAAYCLDMRAAEIVAGLHGLWRPHEFGERLAELGRRYHHAVIAPEVNNHGHAVLETLNRQIHYPTTKLFRRRIRDSVTRRMTEKLGWRTDSVTRPTMLANLAKTLDADSFQVADADLIAECRTFLRTKSEKYEAGPGAHDDRVMAMAIALEARANAPAEPRITVIG